MTPLIALACFLWSGTTRETIPLDRIDENETTLSATSPLSVLASAYGSIGSYSTDTRSRSASAFVTLTDTWTDYYTLGFSTLWLERDDAGGRYYTQEMATARASWLFAYRTDISLHYAYLHEGAITGFSNSTAFHFAGAGGGYWFSTAAVAGLSFTLSLSGGVQARQYRGFLSYKIFEGIWTTTHGIVTDAQWSPGLFSLRQSASISLGGNNYLVAAGELGRRALYFDDELLIVYNQRAIQRGHFLLKGVVEVIEKLYLIPSLEHNLFDDYNATYGSLGLRVIF